MLTFTTNDSCALSISPPLDRDLLCGDLAKLLFVVGDSGSEECQLAISSDLVLKCCAHPAADGVCLPRLDGLVPSFDQLRVDRDREALLLHTHTLMVTAV